MTVPDFTKGLYLTEYKKITDSFQSINDLSKLAISNSLDPVVALNIISILSLHSLHCHPSFDDFFIPLIEESS